jgi:hypothetical protein
MSNGQVMTVDRAGCRKWYDRNFILDETKLRKIVTVLQDFASKLDEPKIVYTIKRSDDSFYTATEIETVLNEDNTQARRLVELAIELRAQGRQGDGDNDAAARVGFYSGHPGVFSRRFGDYHVLLEVNGQDRNWSLLLADELESQVRRSLSTRLPLFLRSRLMDVFCSLAFGVLVAIGMLYQGFRSGMAKSADVLTSIPMMTVDDKLNKILELYLTASSDYGASVLRPLAGLLGAMLIMIFGTELAPITRVVRGLDRSVFYWGDMKEVHDRSRRRLSQWIWSVMVAFAVTLVGGLVLLRFR